MRWEATAESGAEESWPNFFSRRITLAAGEKQTVGQEAAKPVRGNCNYPGERWLMTRERVKAEMVKVVRFWMNSEDRADNIW